MALISNPSTKKKKKKKEKVKKKKAGVENQGKIKVEKSDENWNVKSYKIYGVRSCSQFLYSIGSELPSKQDKKIYAIKGLRV
jgi:hypothetical protein